MPDQGTSEATNKVPTESSSELTASSISICEIPGWTISDFTRTRKLGVWKISRMMENGSAILPPLVPKSSRHANTILVLGALKTRVSRNLYQLADINQPMLYTQKIGYIGKTSYTAISELWHKETGTFLVHSERQFVYIDKKTRKAQLLPKHLENIKDQYPRYEFTVKVNPKPNDPKKAFLTTFKVAASDMDINYHTNHSVYYRFSLDAAYEAWKVGFLQHFSVDPCEYDVKSYEGKYATETFAGDMISIYVWEDDFDKLTLHFEVRTILDDVFVMYQKVVFFAFSNAKL